jgi:putative membrane protein
LRQRFDQHKRIARWTWPIWMYVSVTGVLIYLLLYQIFPQR